MRKTMTFGEWLIDTLSCAAVGFGLIVVVGGPALGGLWLYYALNLPRIALWIGGMVYVVLALIVLMFVMWMSEFWPEPLRNALKKVLEGPWHINLP